MQYCPLKTTSPHADIEIFWHAVQIDVFQPSTPAMQLLIAPLISFLGNYYNITNKA